MPKRIVQSKTWFAATLSFLLLVASSVALVVAVTANNRSARSTDEKICRAVNRVDITIVATLHRTKTNLPKLAYYRDHPTELADQKLEIDREIVRFKPLDCKP